MAEEQINDMEINNIIRRTLTQLMIDCNAATYRSTKGKVRVSGTLKHIGPPKPEEALPAELKKLEDRLRNIKGVSRVIIEFDGFEKNDQTGEWGSKNKITDGEKIKRKLDEIKAKKQLVEDKKDADRLGLSLRDYQEKKKAGLISAKGQNSKPGGFDGEIDLSDAFQEIRLECSHGTSIQFCPCCGGKEFKVFAVLKEGYSLSEGRVHSVDDSYSAPEISFSTPQTPPPAEEPALPAQPAPSAASLLKQEEAEETAVNKPKSNEYNPLTDNGEDDSDNSQKGKILALLQKQKESRFDKKKPVGNDLDLDFDF